MNMVLLCCLSTVDIGLFIVALCLKSKQKKQNAKIAESNPGNMLFDITGTKNTILNIFGLFFGLIFVIDKVMSVATDFYGLNISGLAFLFVVWLYNNSVEIRIYENVIEYKLRGRYRHCDAHLTPDMIESVNPGKALVAVSIVVINMKSGDSETIPTSPKGINAIKLFCRINHIRCE